MIHLKSLPLFLTIAVFVSSCGDQPDTYSFDDSDWQVATDSNDPASTNAETDKNSDTQSVDTTPGDTAPTDTGPADTAPGDTAPADTGPTDTTPGDTSVDPMSQCEKAALRNPDIVCCPTPMNIAVCGEDSPENCCTADLTEAIGCRLDESPLEETCEFTCGLERDKSKCVDNSCEAPFIVDTRSGADWTKQGAWSDYKNTFRPEPNDVTCGDGSGDKDVWFAVLVPAGRTALFREVGKTDCTVRLVEDCHKKTCISRRENPEQIYLQNKGKEATFFNVILSKAAETTHPTWQVAVLPLWTDDS